MSEPEFSSETLVAGEEITATAEYEGTDIEDATLILAFYNNDNQVTRIIPASFVSQDEGDIKVATATSTPNSDEVKARAFVWNSLSGLKPLSKTNSVEVAPAE